MGAFNCHLLPIAKPTDRTTHFCECCGRSLRLPPSIVKLPKRNCIQLCQDGKPNYDEPEPPAPTDGPGTELTELLAELGLKESSTCKCKKRARQMNRWGVEGCRENRETIIGWLKEEAKKASWADSLEAWARAAAMGIFSVDGLLDEALRRSPSRVVGSFEK